ncbi:bifunctional 2-polyprenyl-6-hydroxyphenol methylase/3-demethylubiquinol 3-O-methyltransferase UbiG [Marinivivus vitaminiproducens]|uniref:bifunctional 2-polyprenyl-6-hydroxyphenol methylase/3-demethylubiquinol 3-O-methyltransferase UbiG n=1 Tax=Marinivivus vitaminiproducens TaxID=3035935 RepID=UPI0027A2D6F2|nr:bifunctional 2-polyprenyl-6-hydroxyphenol methylase/3-demethylubiquinol 3-O-methyltransferase UbiG [Geminicoccaceae bacterium SCSIO 64248]
MADPIPPAGHGVDPDEVARFAGLAHQWWDEDGPMAPLHRLNPLRTSWALEQARRWLTDRAHEPTKPLDGLLAADVGCGGGLFAEALAKAGATVTGIDPAEASLAVARSHAHAMGLTIAYRSAGVDEIAREGAAFDLVAAMEVVEHVADIDAFVQDLAGLVRPGGGLLLSTLNRTARSYALAIVGAEYVLRWLPRGTHNWRRFPKPSELAASLRRAGLAPVASTGVAYMPTTGAFRPTRDMSVNYMMFAVRPAP